MYRGRLHLNQLAKSSNIVLNPVLSPNLACPKTLLVQNHAYPKTMLVPKPCLSQNHAYPKTMLVLKPCLSQNLGARESMIYGFQGIRVGTKDIFKAPWCPQNTNIRYQKHISGHQSLGKEHMVYANISGES